MSLGAGSVLRVALGPEGGSLIVGLVSVSFLKGSVGSAGFSKGPSRSILPLRWVSAGLGEVPSWTHTVWSGGVVFESTLPASVAESKLLSNLVHWLLFRVVLGTWLAVLSPV